jgi:hypothetical protein
MVPGQVLEQVPAAGLATWPHLYRPEEVRHAEAATKTSIPTVELRYNMSEEEHSGKSKAHECVWVSTNAVLIQGTQQSVVECADGNLQMRACTTCASI